MGFSSNKRIGSIPVRKSQTPAQDRLNKLISRNADIAKVMRDEAASSMKNKHYKSSVQERLSRTHKRSEPRRGAVRKEKEEARTKRPSNDTNESASPKKAKPEKEERRSDTSTPLPGDFLHTLAADNFLNSFALLRCGAVERHYCGGRRNDRRGANGLGTIGVASDKRQGQHSVRRIFTAVHYTRRHRERFLRRAGHQRFHQRAQLHQRYHCQR